jgi:capsular exopolysaccharide synthesis family protein
MQQLEQQLTAARVEAVSRETRLNEVKKLDMRQLRSTMSMLVTDNIILNLMQNLTDTETRLETMKQDYGPENPMVLAVLAQLDKLQQQLDERLQGIIRGFEVDYQMAKARVDELQKQVDDAKNANLALESEKYRPFLNAQREEELQTRLYEAVKMRIQQASIEMEVPRSPVEVLDHAEPPLPQAYVRPNMWLNVTMGAFVGLVLGIALAFFIEFLDTSIKKIDDVERYLGLPVLGVVGQQAGLLNRGDVSAAHLEAYRMLRTNIEFSKPDGTGASLCVLSSGAGEGKSFTIANLAYVYAQHGARVLVVDSDLRRPGIHQYLGATNDCGLVQYLTGVKAIPEVLQTTSTPNLSVIAAGSEFTAKEALPLLTSQRMTELIEQVGHRFDIVLYDTPPVLGVSDAAIIAREVGRALLVIQHRRYPRNMALRAVQIIQNAGGKLIGVVVNNVQVGQDETYYYYHDQFEPYQRVPTRKTQPVAAAKPASSDEIGLSGKY